MMVQVTAVGAYIRGCRFQASEGLIGAALTVPETGAVTVKDTTFVADTVSVTGQPDEAIEMTTDANLDSWVELTGVTIDAGAYGWANESSLDGRFVAAESLTLLRGVDVYFEQGGVTQGFVNPQTSTGGSRIQW